MKRYLPLFCAILIFLLAITIRVVYNLTTGALYVPRPDSIFYTNIATNLIKNACYCVYPTEQTVDRAPLWPVLLALIFSFNDHQTEAARFFLCGIGAGTCVLTFFFVKDVFGLRLGLLAGIFAAIYPQLYIYDGFLYAESLFIFLTLAFCYSLYHLYHCLKQGRTLRQNSGLLCLCILLLTAIALTRPNGLLYLALLIPWGIILSLTRTLPWKQTAQHITLLVCLPLLLITPWTIRNYIVSGGGFIPIAVGDGTVLLGAYNDQILHPADKNNYGKWIPPSLIDPAVAKKYDHYRCLADCEFARENDYKQVALHWISQHIQQLPTLFRLHFLNLWEPATREADLPIDRYPSQAATFVIYQQEHIPPWLFALAFPGLLLMLRRWREHLFLYFLFLTVVGEALCFYGIARFRAPLEPLLIFFAVATLWSIQAFLRWLLQSPIERTAAKL